MAKLHITKSIAGQHPTTVKVPLFAVGMAARWLPASALRRLTDQGFDVRAIVEAASSGTPYHSAMHVREHGLEKRVDIRVHPR